MKYEGESIIDSMKKFHFYEYVDIIDLCGNPKRVYLTKKLLGNIVFIGWQPWYKKLWFNFRFKERKRQIHTRNIDGSLQYDKFNHFYSVYEPRLWYQWFNKFRSSVTKVKQE